MTLPYPIQFTIKHPKALTAKPVIFEWSPYIHGYTKLGFVLLHHSTTDLEVIAVDHSSLVDISRHGPLEVNGWNQDLWELASGDSITIPTTLPGRYQKLLKPDETYTLLWPGGEIATWEYGTLREHIGQELKDKDNPLVLPGGPHITFSTHTEFPPWPIRAEREAKIGFSRANLAEKEWRFEQKRAKDVFPRTEHMERDPDAPNLNVSLTCPPLFHQNTHLEVTVQVAYDAPVAARPITLHRHHFEDDCSYQLGRLCDGTWRNYDDEDGGCGFRIVDDPDVPVTVGQHDHFVDLQPGESWTTSQRIGYNWTELPDDAEHGEVFRYAFRGLSLDWWNWRSKVDHRDTTVKVPCYIKGPVVDPTDNDGRPKLVVPTSNVVEFTFVK